MRVLSLITKFDFKNEFIIHDQFLNHYSYRDLYNKVLNASFGSFETWSEGLSTIGYETERIFVNIPITQQTWAKENSIHYRKDSWIEDIAYSQIKKISPEVLITSKQTTFNPSFIKKIRNDVNSIKLIIAWCCSPIQDISYFDGYDLILSCSNDILEKFKSFGFASHLLYHGFDPRVLGRININQEPTIEFSFVGAIVKAPGYHSKREKILIDLLKYTNLEIYSSVKKPSLEEYSKNFSKKIITLFLKQIKFSTSEDILKKLKYLNFIDHRISRKVQPAVFGIDMFQKLRDSKISLNVHGDIAQKYAANMRLFEATGVGSCLLTDWKENISDLFEPDKEVVTYRDSKECIEKYRYLLGSEVERSAIAKAGMTRTLRDHTIYKRAEQLDQIIKDYLHKKR